MATGRFHVTREQVFHVPSSVTFGLGLESGWNGVTPTCNAIFKNTAHQGFPISTVLLQNKTSKIKRGKK